MGGEREGNVSGKGCRKTGEEWLILSKPPGRDGKFHEILSRETRTLRKVKKQTDKVKLIRTVNNGA